MKCKLCQEFYKKYPLQKSQIEDVDRELVHRIDDYSSMSPIQCAFDHIGVDKRFESNNWNCKTVNLIREICYEGQELPCGVHYRYCQDEKYATIDIYDIPGITGMALWVSWYKQRGRTDALWILDCYDTPRKPTEKELLIIAKYYDN